MRFSATRCYVVAWVREFWGWGFASSYLALSPREFTGFPDFKIRKLPRRDLLGVAADASMLVCQDCLLKALVLVSLLRFYQPKNWCYPSVVHLFLLQAISVRLIGIILLQ